MSKPTIHYIYSFCVLTYISVAVSASLESISQVERCDKEHRFPSSNSYGCGRCKLGFSENSNHVCISACPSRLECLKENRHSCEDPTEARCGSCLQSYIEVKGHCLTQEECTAYLDCDSRHRKPCDSQGSCGPCEDPYIQVAGTCITEEGADRAIRTIEELLAARLEGSNPTNGDNSGDAVKKSEVHAADADIIDPAPRQPLVNEEDNKVGGAYKRVSAAGMEDPSAIQLSEAESDGATVGFSKLLFFCIIAGATLICIISLIIAAICWYRLHKVRKSMQPSEYQGYKAGQGSPKESMARSDSGDGRLAKSAQMFHFEQHKQQMLALEKSLSDKLDDSDPEDPEENEDGNYTVYECPGLAPAGEMEVSNPLFQASSKISPSTSPTTGSPASMPSPPQSAMTSSQEGDNSAAAVHKPSEHMTD